MVAPAPAEVAAAEWTEDALFVDVTATALPGVATTCGAPTKRWIVEVNGGGLALADFDGDDVLDLVVVDGSTVERARAGEPGYPPRLFLGDGAGGFRPGGARWALPAGRWGMGCATGDWNGDGRVDLVVTEWGPDRVFLNLEEGFREVAAPGLARDGWSSSAAAVDFDRDGHLDLFVCGYLEFDADAIPPTEAGDARWKGHAVMSGPEGLSPAHDRLYRGRGDGTFEEVSAARGWSAVAPGYALGVTTLDVDRDGDTDLYVANDSTPNHLWRNDGAVFREVGFELGLAYDAHGREQAGMGIACGDLDGDGADELFVTNFSGESNALYRPSTRRARYRERSAAAGLAGPSLGRLGWGTAALDADLDGALDLVVANGHVYPQADLAGTDTSYAQDDQLFLQRDDRFLERGLVAGTPRVSRALTAGDLDHDGDVDLIVMGVEGPVRVLHGTAADRGRGGLTVRVTDGGAPAIGAVVTLEELDEDLAVVRAARAEVRTAGGFQAALPGEVHFALTSPAAHVLTVRFTEGAERRLVLDEGPKPRVLSIGALR